MRQPTAPSLSIRHLLVGVVAFCLLAGAVVSTSSVAQLSYEAAQLQHQADVLAQQQQLLQEQLAQAHALSTPLSYAQEQGFSQVAQAQAELDVTPSLAQAR